MSSTEAWYADHFDHIAPQMEHGLHEMLAHMREHHPVAQSEEHGGFWAVTGYEEVLRVAQDWARSAPRTASRCPPTSMSGHPRTGRSAPAP